MPHSKEESTHLLLQKGKYVFIDDLEQQQPEGVSVPFFTAKAIIILEKDAEFL